MIPFSTTFRPLLAVALAIVVTAALAATSANAAVDPANQCAASKQKAAAKKLSDKVKCHGVAIKKGVAVDPACLTKAETKFDAAFAKAELKGGCATTGDAAAVEAFIDGVLSDLLAALPGAGGVTTTTSTTTTTTTLPTVNCDALNDCGLCVACTQEPGGACVAANAACNASTDC